MKKDPRDIFGEYDPPYNFNNKPTKEQRDAAERLRKEYEKRIAKKHK